MGTTVQNNRIVDGVIWKQMLLFFFPLFLGTLFQQLYSMVDAVILGQFVGKEALGAVGGPDAEIINLLVNFFVSLASGASVVISQHYGARREDALRSAVYTGMVLAVAGGVLLMLVGLTCSSLILHAIHTPDELFGHALIYLRYYFLGIIPSMIYNMGAGILRAIGDTRRPLYYLIVCCFTNIALDLLLVLVIPLAAAGTAIATSLSQLLCAALVLTRLLRTKESYRLQLSRKNFSAVQLRQMLRLGVPAGLQSSMYNIANICIQATINTLGTNSIAGWAAFRKIDSIFWPISSALGITVMTFTGQNFGARNYGRIKETVRYGILIDALLTLVFSGTVLLARQPLLMLFNRDPEVLRIGEQLLTVFASAYVTYFLTEVFSAAMRGVGNGLYPALLTMFGTCVLRLGLLFLYINRAPTNFKIALCYPITWIVTSLLFFIYYRRGRWLSKQIRP